MGLDRLSAFIIAGIFKKSMPGPLFPRAEEHPHQDQYPGGSQAAQQDHRRLRQGAQVGGTGGGGTGLVQVVEGFHLVKEGVPVGLVHRLAPAHRLGGVLNELSGGVPQGGRAVEDRGDKGVVGVVQQQLGGGDLHVVVGVVVLPGSGQIVLILLRLLGLGGDGDIPLGLGVGDLYLVGEQELGEQPGGQHLLRILLVEDTDGGALGDHLGVLRVKLGDGHDGRLKVHKGVGTDVGEGGVGSHPGGTGGGVDGKDTLAGVEEVGGVAGDFEGGEGPGLHMLGDGGQQLLGGVVEELDVSAAGGVARSQLLEHLDHHVVGGLVDEGDHHLLTVEKVIALGVLFRGRFRYLPDKVPGEGLRQGVAQLLHVGLVDVAGLGGAHVRHGVVGPVQIALVQKLGDNLLLGGAVKF